MATPELWQASLTLALAEAEQAEAALEPLALSVARFEAEPGGRTWQVDVVFAGEPDRRALRRALGGLSATLRLSRLPERNWVVESLQHLPPVAAGRFYVHGAHHPRHPDPARIDLTIEAGLAFGSGQHATTRGCLLEIDRMARQRRFRQVLDVGCGSGVLALAAARLWRRPVLATDIDPVATRVAMANARQNRAGAWLRTQVADGLAHRRTAVGRPYDLIVANILARPLIRLAPAMARHLAANGALVLSGLLGSQERMVLAAYRQQRLVLARRLRIGDWSTLTLVRRRNAISRPPPVPSSLAGPARSGQ